ncbi:hypothetical protein AJ80_07887 [Polytolypa hystricis UAMH7299]|uniref:CSN8/PSMD8/EIF3K domain-containing protein n=1 Tax=Polytolypa hystricis (strain UAMH7299) TaxID=1447883 RepID=A0A2B7XHN9_POLH7|nr:hypothetical protein AJ80_07887 [Polytolypa hystricis UAMH7299]
MTDLSIEDLSKLLAAAPSPAKLLKSLIELEGPVSLRFGETHLNSDTEFLSTFYSIYILVLLWEDEVNEAHMLTRRLPQSLLRPDTFLQNALSLLKAVWQEDYEQVYDQIRQPSWPDSLKPLVRSYQSYFQDKAFEGLTRAYSAIRPSTLVFYLGLDPSVATPTEAGTEDASRELVSFLTKKGWEWDSESKLFTPKAAPVTKPVDSEAFKIGKLVGLIGTHGD